MKFTVEIDIKDRDVEKLKENAEHYGYDIDTLLSQLLKTKVAEEVRTTYTTLW